MAAGTFGGDAERLTAVKERDDNAVLESAERRG
jgi:hypothetical protein